MNKELTQKQNYKKHLKYKSDVYSKYSKRKEQSNKEFIENIVILNKTTNESKALKYDYLQNARDNYLWFVFNQKLLEDKIQKMGGYSAIFITLTLPSSYHKYFTKRKSYNYQYNEENTIDKGYKLLQDSFRNIYNKFKVYDKFVKTFYSRVIEPHKDFTPHLHSIVYVPNSFVNEFKKHTLNTIKNYELGEQYDLEVIKDIERSSAYLLKYIAKNTNPQSEKDFHKFNGWKKLHKIRVFTQSQCELPRYIFKKVNSVLGLSKGLKGKNPIQEILENCNIVVNTFNTRTKKTKTKEYGNSTTPKFEIKIERDVTKFTKKEWVENMELIGHTNRKKDLKNIYLDSNHFYNVITEDEKIEVCEIYYKRKIFKDDEYVYRYRINEFKILEIETNKIRYNKNDFVLASKYYEKDAIESSMFDMYFEKYNQYFFVIDSKGITFFVEK